VTFPEALRTLAQRAGVVLKLVPHRLPLAGQEFLIDGRSREWTGGQFADSQQQIELVKRASEVMAAEPIVRLAQCVIYLMNRGDSKMATVELDPHTADQLNALAAASGMTAEAYLKLLLPASANGARAKLSLTELDSLLSENAFDGPTLPTDFSRADIYDGHD
jgi:hypothetical protein